MPRMDNPSPATQLIKLLLIGDGKIGKTHYAAEAVKAGLNVLFVDGDVGAQTINRMVEKKHLTPQQASHIHLLTAGDQIVQGNIDTRFCDSIREMTNLARFKWNDTKERVADIKDSGDEIWVIKPAMMNSTSLLIIDSWTAYIESLMQKVAIECGVILAEATSSAMRPVYQGAALRATAMLKMIRAARCHVIVLAHTDEYQHKTAPDGKRVSDIKEHEMIVDWTRMIPKSTSKPHGLLLPKYFTDTAWMTLNPAGSERMLDFRPDPGRVGGGHFDGIKSSKEYSFAKLIESIGGTIPGDGNWADTDSWLEIIPPGEEQKPAEPKVLDGTKSTPLKGFAGLGKKA